MKPLSAVEFRNRQMVVTIKDYCESCKTLQPEVIDREHKAYYPVYFAIKIKCCAGCFETAKRNAAAEASGLIVC